MNYNAQYGSPNILAQLFLGIFITAIAYGAFPAIFALCKPKISARRYRWICFLVNFAVFLCFALIGGNYNAAPYFLWTLVYCAIFKRFLPEIEPPVDYSKMEKKSFKEISQSIPEDVLEKCKAKRGSRDGIASVAESFVREGIIPAEYVPALIEEYMKPVNEKRPLAPAASPVENTQMFCRNCGKQIPNDSKFCSYCGTEVKPAADITAATPASASEQQTVTPEKSMDYRAFIAIGAVVLLLIAIVVIVGVMARSGKAESTPVPTETVAPTPIPSPAEPVNTIILFPSPEQYAEENEIAWPDNVSWEREWGSAWGSAYTAYYSTFDLVSDAVTSGAGVPSPLSLLFSDTSRDYANSYMAARAEGKDDQEAHITALVEAGIDKFIIGKKSYAQFLQDSSIGNGSVMHDAKQYSTQAEYIWIWAWEAYKDARDEQGKNHDQAVESVKWRCFSNPNGPGGEIEHDRYAAYLEQGLSADEASAKWGKEKEELFNCLREAYEGPGLDTAAIETSAIGQADSSPTATVYNGQLFITPSYECLCPFEVSVQGEDAYYIYLKYRNSSSVDSRGTSNVPESFAVDDIAFYIAPNSTVEIDVPVGVYKLYYACGDTWYGPEDLFGEETVYSTSDELLEFYTDQTTAYGTTLELWAQYGGDFETKYISASQFPG